MSRSSVRYRSIAADSARWDGFAFRPDDIVISTPPKCGTTWTQMICALLIFQTPDIPGRLDLMSPWLDMQTRTREGVFAELEKQTHRRFIKSHTPLDGLPLRAGVTYVCVGRDPRDVALSFDNHLQNMDLAAFFKSRQEAVGMDDIAELMPEGPPTPAATQVERFWQFVDDDGPVERTTSSLRSTLHHLATFFDARTQPHVVLLHYDDLKADLSGQMRALAARLSIDVPEDRWTSLVEAATFEGMRSRAAEVAPNIEEALWHDNERFFNRGTSGQWRDLLDSDGLRRYAARVGELASQGLSKWAHRGPIV